MLAGTRLRSWFSVKAYDAAKNYYKVLNVPENASQNDIKKAFRTLAKQYHPDSTKGKEELFKEVNEAYQVLSDNTVKKEYDQVRATNNRTSSRSQEYSQGYASSSQKYQQHPQNNYRGYHPEQGWNNRTFR